MSKAKLRKAILSLDKERQWRKEDMDAKNRHCEHWRNGIRKDSFERIDREFMQAKNALINAPQPGWDRYKRPFRNVVRWFVRRSWRKREHLMRTSFLTETSCDLVGRKVIAGYGIDVDGRGVAKDGPLSNELAQTAIDVFYEQYDKAMADNQPL